MTIRRISFTKSQIWQFSLNSYFTEGILINITENYFWTINCAMYSSFNKLYIYCFKHLYLNDLKLYRVSEIWSTIMGSPCISAKKYRPHRCNEKKDLFKKAKIQYSVHKHKKVKYCFFPTACVTFDTMTYLNFAWKSVCFQLNQ